MKKKRTRRTTQLACALWMRYQLALRLVQQHHQSCTFILIKFKPNNISQHEKHEWCRIFHTQKKEGLCHQNIPWRFLNLVVLSWIRTWLNELLDLPTALLWILEDEPFILWWGVGGVKLTIMNTIETNVVSWYQLNKGLTHSLVHPWVDEASLEQEEAQQR